jgi:hypothetical protein
MGVLSAMDLASNAAARALAAWVLSRFSRRGCLAELIAVSVRDHTLLTHSHALVQVTLLRADERENT